MAGGTFRSSPQPLTRDFHVRSMNGARATFSKIRIVTESMQRCPGRPDPTGATESVTRYTMKTVHYDSITHQEFYDTSSVEDAHTLLAAAMPISHQSYSHKYSRG